MGAANGRPAVFFDTSSYFSQGEYLATRLHLVPPPAGDRLSDPTSIIPEAMARMDTTALTVAGARSPFYGLLLFLTATFGTLWVLAFVQALLAAWVVCLMLRAMDLGPSIGRWLAMTTILALGTSLPFFAAFAMPDIFIAIGIVVVALTLVYPEHLSWQERVGCLVLLALCAAFHRSCLITVAALAICAVAALVFVGLDARRIAGRVGTVAAALAIAGMAPAAFDIAYKRDTGLSRIAPPFLMARVLADGPGRTYLAAFCPGGASPTLCAMAKRAFKTEGDILWNTDPAVGIYQASDAPTRRRLKAEEPAFVAAAVAYSPWAQLKASTRNVLEQIRLYWVDDPLENPSLFLSGPFDGRTAMRSVVPGAAACIDDESVCDARVDDVVLARLHLLVLVVALLVIIARVAAALRPGLSAGADGRVTLAAAGLLVLGLVLNDAVCAIFAGSFPRYEARAVWLLPMAAFMIAADAWHRARVADKPRPTLVPDVAPDIIVS